MSRREERMRRWMMGTIVLQSAMSVAVRWLTAVLVRLAFQEAAKLDDRIDNSLFEPAGKWRAIFLVALGFWEVVGLTVAASAVTALCHSVQLTMQESWANERSRGLRRKLVERALGGSVGGQDQEASVATQTSFLLQEIETIRSFESSAFFDRRADYLVLFFVAVAGFIFHARLTAIALGSLAILIVVPKLVSFYVLSSSDAQLSNLVRLVHRLTSDIVRTADVIAVALMDKLELRKLDDLESSALPIEKVRQRRVMALRVSDQTLFYALQPFLVIVVFVWIQGAASASEALEEAFAVVLTLLIIDGGNAAFENLKSTEGEATRYALSIANVNKWVVDADSESVADDDDDDDDQDSDGGPEKSSAESIDGDIVAEEVEITFSSGSPIRYPSEVRFCSNKITALTGDSGAGKSSLLKALAGLVQPTNGSIWFGDVKLEPWSLRKLRGQMAMVSQDSLLFARSIRENVLYSSTDSSVDQSDADDRMRHALEQVGLLDWIFTLEDGVDTVLDMNENQVSGGQAQRLQLARLLCLNPSIVLLDEPMSALDPGNRNRILEHLRTWLAGRTTIWISHSSEVAQLADRRVHLTQPLASGTKSMTRKSSRRTLHSADSSSSSTSSFSGPQSVVVVQDGGPAEAFPARRSSTSAPLSFVEDLWQLLQRVVSGQSR